jgi:tRNA pseudouridine55 synthase
VNFIININKPEGITSFDVVSRIRRLFKIKRVGHCGTLDPFASGVLPVCVGKATAAVRYMDTYDKRYSVEAVFGKKTDTQDITGKVIDKRELSIEELDKIMNSDFADLRDAIEKIKITETQMPPMYSEIKIDGTPLYKLARQGIEIERNLRKVKIYEINIVDINAKELISARLDIHCSKGTYIRTICDDLGEMTGYFGYAKSLCRTACGPFKIEESVSLEDLENMLSENPDIDDIVKSCSAIVDIPYALAGYKSIVLSRENAKKLIQGQKISVEDDITGTDPICVYDEKNIWIGVARQTPETGIIKAERIFADVQNY